jgi:mRNA-degrading endonuclease RelE of RelBE toxin-antitoxin system
MVIMFEVRFTAKARKQAGGLPEKIRMNLYYLVRDIRERGPVRPEKPNFGKLKGRDKTYHCHLNKGKPRYVAVWRMVDETCELVEVQYAGTHEKAPY